CPLLFPYYSPTRRSFTHCARRMRRKPRTGPGTRCDTGQNGQTKRVPCAFGVFSTITAQPGLQIRYITCGWGMTTFSFRAGFAAGRTRLEARAVRREVLRVVRVALIVPLSITRRVGIIYSGLRLALLLTANKIVMASAAGQSACRKVYACASSRPKSESPLAFAGGCPTPVPARASRLAVRDVFVIQVTELADSRHAIQREFPRFARGQLDQRNVAFFAEQLRRSPRRTHQLSALAWRKLKVVHHRAGRNITNRQRVAGQNVRRGAVLHGHSDFQAHRMQNVALLAIRIMQQDDSGRTIRVVFDGGNLRRNSSLFTPKINQAVVLLVPATAMP